jgi:hypothetical protein
MPHARTSARSTIIMLGSWTRCTHIPQTRKPSWDLVVISAVPVADPLVAPIAPQSGVADFVVFTKRPSH